MGFNASICKWASRGGAIGLVLALFVVFTPGWGSAATQESFNAEPSGYYTQTADPLKSSGQQGQTVTCQPQVPADRRCTDAAQVTGGTPAYPRKDNYVYVANVNGNPDAIGAVAIPLFSVPFDATIQALSLTVAADTSSSNGAVSFQTDAPGFQACMNTEGPAYQDAAPYENRPATDCSVRSLPVKGASKGNLVFYTLNLMPMATAWANGRENNGLMLVPTPDAQDNFQAALQGAGVNRESMMVKVSYTAPESSGFTFVPSDGGFSPSTDALGTVTFGGTSIPEVAPVPPPFKVAPTPAPVLATRPFRGGVPQNKWWMFIGLPIGAAVLAALARGVAESGAVEQVARSGPVGRLMRRPSSNEGAA